MRFSAVSVAVLAVASSLLVACSSNSGGSAGTGGTSGGGSGGAGGTAMDAGPGTGGFMVDPTKLTWRAATLTDFTSYPDPGSDECIKFSGCMYEGMFAAFGRQVKTKEWVMQHNIAAVHEKDFNAYVGKTLRLRKDDKMIDVVVYDECNDADCNGCCTRNAMPSGFLIDIEIFTFMRFGVPDGQIEWACLDPDCPK